MKPIIDIHSHILPGVDDGCKSQDEALAMLKMYEDQNVEAVICTPHFGPCGIPGADVEGAFRWLQSKSRKIKLYLGNEVHIDCIDSKGLRSLAGSDFVLVEFEEWSYQTNEEEALKYLAAVDHFYYDLILAHAERYDFVQKNPAFCRKLTEAGIKLQINAYDVYDTQTEATKKTARWLLDNQLVSFIGSDAHGASRRAPALKNGVQWIYDNCPEAYADAVVHDNAFDLINGRPSEQYPPELEDGLDLDLLEALLKK